MDTDQQLSMATSMADYGQVPQPSSRTLKDAEPSRGGAPCEHPLWRDMSSLCPGVHRSCEQDPLPTQSTSEAGRPLSLPTDGETEAEEVDLL